MDPERFVTALRRLTPNDADPSEPIGTMIHSAWTASVAALVKAFSADLARADMIGLQLTHSAYDRAGRAVHQAEVIGQCPAVSAAVDDLATYGEATVELTVQLRVDAEPVGVAALTFSIAR
jgi:hypothetical protein